MQLSSDDRFIKVVEAVEAEGGQLLTKAHVAPALKYEIQDSNNRKRVIEVPGAGCGHEALLNIPYDASTGNTKVDGEIVLCAICDLLDLTPRFQVL